MAAAKLLSGTGAPNGTIYGNPGDLYQDEASPGELWVKETGAATNTGWALVISGTTVAVVFDDSVAGTNSNLRGNQAANRSPINNTKTQIVDLSSKDGTTDPAATGATGKASTIPGGNDNSASGDYATVIGGRGNKASTTSTAGGDRNTASGVGAAALGGFGNTVSGDYSRAFGSGNTVAGDYSGVDGNNNTVAGDYNLVGGNLNTAPGDYNLVAGNQNHANGSYSFLSGNNNTITSIYAEAVGDTNTVSADTASAQGNGNTASGYASRAQGSICTASDDQAFAHGTQAVASRENQRAFACGKFTTNGDNQTSELVFRGTTPGTVPGETTELLTSGFAGSGTMQMLLADGRAYDFTVTAVCGGVQAGPTRVSRTIKISFNVRRDGGLSVLTASGASDSYGDAATATWTLTPSIGAAPDRVVLTFGTGAGAASRCHVAARVEFAEVVY